MGISTNVASTARYIDHGSDASLDDLVVNGNMSVAMWIRRQANGANQHILSKDNSTSTGWVLLIDNGTNEGGLRLVARRSSNGSAISATGVATLGDWVFVAATFDSGASSGTHLKLYSAAANTSVAETGYDSRSDGSGTSSSDTTASVLAGNIQRASSLYPFLGDIGAYWVFNETLTLAQLNALRFNPKRFHLPSCVLYSESHGTGTQTDLSGEANTGTVNLASTASHYPFS